MREKIDTQVQVLLLMLKEQQSWEQHSALDEEEKESSLEMINMHAWKVRDNHVCNGYHHWITHR